MIDSGSLHEYIAAFLNAWQHELIHVDDNLEQASKGAKRICLWIIDILSTPEAQKTGIKISVKFFSKKKYTLNEEKIHQFPLSLSLSLSFSLYRSLSLSLSFSLSLSLNTYIYTYIYI